MRKHQAFDATAHQAFYGTQHQARASDGGGSETGLGNVISITWIDESESVYTHPDTGEAKFLEDLALLEAALLLSVDSRCGCLVPGEPISRVMPEGYTEAGPCSVVSVARRPTLAQNITEFNRIRTDMDDPDLIALNVDNSGSMTTATIQPGFGQFVEWLGENYPNAGVLINEFREIWLERWVRHTALAIQRAAP